MTRVDLKLALLILLSGFLFLFQLNATHLTNWDEAWHAAIARNMARTNDFITPVYNDQIWFATAPLYLWILAIWFKLTNFSLLGVRLFSALAGFGTVVLTYLIGKKLDSKKTGLIAAFVLATTIQFLFRARQGNLDAPLAFFNTLAIFSFVKGKENPNWFLGIAAATAFGFLTKSVLGLFPLSLLIFIPRKKALQSLLVFFIITSPWHLLALARHGQSFYSHYFLQYVFSKATNANPVSGTDIFWYLNVLKHGLKFWIFILPFALIWSFFRIFKSPRLRLILPFFWVTAPLVILSLARMRNDWYLISIYPAVALLISLFLSRMISLKQNRIWFWLTISLTLILGLGNILKYWKSFVVPETVAAEVSLATKAKSLSKPDQSIMLDDNYLPVASLYTDRHIIVLRFSRSYESLVGEQSLKVATQSGSRLVLTNTQTINQLIDSLNQPKFETILSKDDKLLIRLHF